MSRFAFVLVVAAAACGSRSSLLVSDEDPVVGGDAGMDQRLDDALVDSPVADARSDSARHDASARCTGWLRGWSEVDVLLGGDFERLVPAAASASSGIWLSLS